MERPLTVPEAARELDYHPDHVRRLLRAGTMRGEQVGGRWLIGRQEIQRIKDLQGPDGRLPYGLEPEQ